MWVKTRASATIVLNFSKSRDPSNFKALHWLFTEWFRNSLSCIHQLRGFLGLSRWLPLTQTTPLLRCLCRPRWRTAFSWRRAKPMNCCPWSLTCQLTSSHHALLRRSKLLWDGECLPRGWRRVGNLCSLSVEMIDLLI